MKLQDYKLTKNIKRKIILGIMTSREYGISCLFVPLNALVGVKLFPRKYDRDFSLKWQKILYNKKLSPMVGQTFTIHFEWPKIYDDSPDGIDELFFEDLVLYGFFTQRANTKFKNKSNLLNKVYEKALNEGMVLDDLHCGNIGLIGQKLVIIDTDPVSMRNIN